MAAGHSIRPLEIKRRTVTALVRGRGFRFDPSSSPDLGTVWFSRYAQPNEVRL
jgi:hypothetical protein